MIGGRPEQDLEGLLEPPGPVTTGDEGGVDDPSRGSRLTGLPAHRCDLPGRSRWPVVFRVGPGSIREVGDEAAGRGPERDYNGCPQAYRLRSDGARPSRDHQGGPLRRGAGCARGWRPARPSCRGAVPRPKAAKQAARRKKRIEQKVSELFEHRYLFVQRHLTPLRAGDACGGSPAGCRSSAPCAGLMEEVYRLFDRRCRTATALAKLARVAGPVAAVRPAAGGAEEAAVAGPGEGAGVPGRAADGSDVQRGGARQPALPEDAEDGVPGADAVGRSRAGWRWTCCASGRRKAGPRRPRPSQGQSGMISIDPVSLLQCLFYSY